MYGDDPAANARLRFRLCCGPRCGAEPGHQAIYRAAEAAAERSDATLRPSMCQGFCGLGVTLELPSGERKKLRGAGEARVQIENWKEEQK